MIINELAYKFNHKKDHFYKKIYTKVLQTHYYNFLYHFFSKKSRILYMFVSS